jgi:tRNA pseudouridine38-40 synthase
VHALAQVAAFSLARTIAPETLARALNARLPGEVRVLSAEDVPPAFHARFDARAKTYRYRIWNAEVIPPFERRYAWHITGNLDDDAMKGAARLLDGCHDFAAFQAAGSSVQGTERMVSASLVGRPDLDGALVTYEISGNGFLRYMVRNIVGTLVEIGRRRRPVEWMGEVLRSKVRASAGPTAPPHGLFLVRVDYLG